VKVSLVLALWAQAGAPTHSDDFLLLSF